MSVLRGACLFVLCAISKSACEGTNTSANSIICEVDDLWPTDGGSPSSSATDGDEIAQIHWELY